MKYLGIDYGTKNIGLSISDDGGMVAFPYSVLQNKESLINEISKIIDTEKIHEIVVGHSKNKEGDENKLMREIYEFIGQLSLSLGIPIHLEDERFSSFEARQMISGFGGEQSRNPARRRGTKEGKRDDKAATVILQRFLDKK